MPKQGVEYIAYRSLTIKQNDMPHTSLAQFVVHAEELPQRTVCVYSAIN